MRRALVGEKLEGRYAKGGIGLKILVFLVLVLPSGLLAFFDYEEAAVRLAGMDGAEGALNGLLARDAVFLLLINLAALAIMRLLDAQQRRERREEAILASVGEGVAVIDNARDITFMNAAGARILGVAPETTLRRKLKDVFGVPTDLQDRPVPEEERASSLALAGSVSQATYRITRTDGSRFTGTFTAAPVLFEGRNIGVVFVFHDITREMELERERGELLSIASHQLRTPLTAMRWITEMLLRGDVGKLKPDQLEQIGALSESTERLTELVNDMLNASRLESGKITAEPVETDLPALAKGAAAEIEPLARQKNQKLELRLPKKLPRLTIDGKLVRQAVLNLLSNAVKYTPDGGRISFSIEPRAEDVLVTVKDTGIGVPPEQQKRLFEKFFRADNAVQSGVEGTGLGLYVVKQIVELSGGKLEFVSEPGKGTSFFFTLPLKR